MSTEIIAAIIGALIGAASAHFFGWRAKAKDDQRRQKSLASAVLWEIYPLANTFATLRGPWPGHQVVVEFPTVVLDSFPEHVELFKEDTVTAVLDLIGSVRDVRTGLAALRSGEARDPDKIRDDVRIIAASCLGKIVIVRDAIRREGGRLRDAPAWPTQESVEQLVADTKRYLLK